MNSDLAPKKEIVVDWEGWGGLTMPDFLRRDKSELIVFAGFDKEKVIGSEGLEDVL